MFAFISKPSIGARIYSNVRFSEIFCYDDVCIFLGSVNLQLYLGEIENTEGPEELEILKDGITCPQEHGFLKHQHQHNFQRERKYHGYTKGLKLEYGRL